VGGTFLQNRVTVYYWWWWHRQSYGLGLLVGVDRCRPYRRSGGGTVRSVVADGQRAGPEGAVCWEEVEVVVWSS
jgi:hypothetical protein